MGSNGYERYDDRRDVCPHCEKLFKRGNSIDRHVRSCAKRPSNDELRALEQKGMAYYKIGKRYGVSEWLARQWCLELNGLRVERKRNLECDLVVYDDGVWTGCRGCRMDHGGDWNPSWASRWCSLLVVNYGYMPCERIDERQVDQYAEMGFDMWQIAADFDLLMGHLRWFLWRVWWFVAFGVCVERRVTRLMMIKQLNSVTLRVEVAQTSGDPIPMLSGKEDVACVFA